jgi:hypothetical protein
MADAGTPASGAAPAAVCATHPSEPVVGTCTRCGVFVCAQDRKLVDAKLYCATCAARPDVDWLDGFRRKYWGRRDGWAWLFGIGAPIQLVTAVGMLLDPEARLMAPFVLLAAAAGALWWLKRRIARWLVLLSLVASGAYAAIAVSPYLIVSSVLPIAIVLSVINATRTKLFFELEVSRGQLRRMWDLYANNQVARYALSLGVGGLLIWPFAPIALACGVVGLLRVDPNARPPVGRKGSAIAGIVLGAAGMCIAAFAIFAGSRY